MIEQLKKTVGGNRKGGLMEKYYHLKKDEIIQEGDEIDTCRDGWRDDTVWVKAKGVGECAPDPRFPSHRQYRRLIKDSQ